jgi:hypothetical protein
MHHRSKNIRTLLCNICHLIYKNIFIGMMCWQKYTPFEIQYIITNHSGYKINQYRIAYNYFICISVRCKFVGRFPSASFEGSLTFRRWTCLHISWMQGKLMYISTTIDRLHFGSVAIVCFFSFLHFDCLSCWQWNMK